MKYPPQVHVWILSPKLATSRDPEKLQDISFPAGRCTGMCLKLYWVAGPVLALSTAWSCHRDSLITYKELAIHDPPLWNCQPREALSFLRNLHQALGHSNMKVMGPQFFPYTSPLFTFVFPLYTYCFRKMGNFRLGVWVFLFVLYFVFIKLDMREIQPICAMKGDSAWWAVIRIVQLPKTLKRISCAYSL